jgi:hypothetical protein
MKQIALIIVATLLILALMFPMVAEVHATGCDDVGNGCTHYPGSEWTTNDVGTGCGVHAWSSTYYSWYEHEDWMFRRVAAASAYGNNSQTAGNFRCYRATTTFSETYWKIGGWTGPTWIPKDYPPNPPYGQSFYLQDWGTLSQPIHDDSFSQRAYAEATAYFYAPGSWSDLWYCFTYASVSRV